MSNVSKRKREGTKMKSVGDHKEFLKRISKTLYYGTLPSLPCLSLPLTEMSCELWSVSQRGRSLRRLHAEQAAAVSRDACVSPCALVLAIFYLERLHACNPRYLADTHPHDLFLVSLMVGNKYLQDDGEDEEVMCSEWAASGGLELAHLKRLEVDFLQAIEWRVHVSEDAFEAGLRRLERQVALRQALLRGYFTYGDLAAACGGGAQLARLLGSLATAWLALTLNYVTGVLTLVTSTLVISQAWLPAAQHAAALSLRTDTGTSNVTAELPLLNNSSGEVEESLAERVSCCEQWRRYQEAAAPPPRRDLDPRRGGGDSVLGWLYQSSLLDPLQRWLQKMGEFGNTSAESDPRGGGGARHWLDLSKLSALMVTVADR